jgi:hypothetical protein
MASASWRFRIMRSTPKGRDDPVYDHIVTQVVTRRGVCKSTEHNRHDGNNSKPRNYNATLSHVGSFPSHVGSFPCEHHGAEHLESVRDHAVNT